MMCEQYRYTSALPLYFPRSRVEELVARRLLPKDIGDEKGAALSKDRTVRVASFVGRRSIDSDDELKSQQAIDVIRHVCTSRTPSVEGDSDSEENPFNSMTDHLWGQDDSGSSTDRSSSLAKQKIEIAAEMKYLSFLEKARRADLDAVKKLNILYRGGIDESGRVIMVFLANRIPASGHVDMDNVLL